MKNRFLIMIAIALFLVPQVVFAAWWNPRSWKIPMLFKRSNSVEIVEKVEINPPSKDQSGDESSPTNTPIPVTNPISALKPMEKSEIKPPILPIKKVNTVITVIKETKPIVSKPTLNNVKVEQGYRDVELEKLKKEVAELKQKQELVNVAPAPSIQQPIATPPPSPTIACNGKNWSPCPSGQRFYCPAVGDAQCLIDKVSNQNDQNNIESWEQIDARNFAYADAKGWTSHTSTNALGEKRYYRKEGSQWVRKNSESEIQQSFVPTPPPNTTPCNGVYYTNCPTGNDFICPSNGGKAYCHKDNTQEQAEILNGLLNDFKKAQEEILAKQQQTNKQKKNLSNCMADISPEDFRLLTPQALRHVIESRCGAGTPQSDLNYKLYQQQEYQACLDKNPANQDQYCAPLKPIFY